MKTQNFEPNKVLETIRDLENMVGAPNFDIDQPEKTQINIRVNESIGPAKFKSDPLIPGGYMANSLTIRAMRQDIFVLGDSLEDLSAIYTCACGESIDLQFWKLCPHCARDIRPC